MRLPLLRPAALASIFALAGALFAAQYSSTSPQELQRRLERDTNQLIDSLRKQRNTPSPRSSPGPDPWTQQIRAREAQRQQQAQLDADWRRDHPNETRKQYFDRIEREAADQAREARRERDEAIRAQRAREAAERERAETADWARIRASYGGYAAEVRPPAFSTAAESLDWCLLHESRTNNEWAGTQAAMLLIEGIGVAQDIPKALRLLDPNSATAKKSGTRHPETEAVFAYLQLMFPDAAKAAGLEANPALARANLEKAATRTDLAKWYLARVLNRSSQPADQRLALRLVTPGAQWTRNYFASTIKPGPTGRDPIFRHLGSVSIAIVERQRVHLPALLQELPLAEFEQFDDLLPYTSEPLRTQAMALYAETVAERVVPLTPATEFNYYAFDQLLGQAGEAGIDAVYGLAALRRFHLLDIEDRHAFKPSWGHWRDTDRTLAALTRWAARDDVLGRRARLAIEGLAVEAASSQWWTPSPLKEVRDYRNAVREHTRLLGSSAPSGSPKSIFQLRDDAETAKIDARKLALEAFARRDAAAPELAAIPGIIASMKVAAEWREEAKRLKTPETADPGFLAVTHASFDLNQAAALCDAALAPDTPEAVCRHNLFQAVRLGDAFAPAELARELGSDLPAATATTLRQLTEARLARDEAANRPRALLARAVQIRFRSSDEAVPALTAAASAGSTLAPRLLLNDRIGSSMARESDRPASWGLDPALIAELDAALAAGENTGPAHAEWTVVRCLFSEDEAVLLDRNWFHYLRSWARDRDERLADAALAKAIMPQIDAILATLAEWPGLNQDDPLRAAWADDAARAREQAEERVRRGNGTDALKAFLAAAGRGDRGALELLARHIRDGDGSLPRSPEIADRLQAAAFKMTIADAEVGDIVAADYLGECYRNGANGVTADPVQALAWLSYAASLGHAGSARILAQEDASGLNRTPAEILHWIAVRDACEYSEFLPAQPRRLTTPRLSLAAVRPQLEAALTALQSFRSTKPVELTPEQEDAEILRIDAAKAELKKDPANGLVLFARIAANGNRYIPNTIAAILARGDGGVEPDPALAQRFHAAARSLLVRDAEYGDMNAAGRLATYALGLGEKPDIPAALRWLTYSAELGSSDAAETLARLYTEGAPGLPANAKQAARWAAFAESTSSDDFKPRAPLR